MPSDTPLVLSMREPCARTFETATPRPPAHLLICAASETVL